MPGKPISERLKLRNSEAEFSRHPGPDPVASTLILKYMQSPLTGLWEDREHLEETPPCPNPVFSSGLIICNSIF